MISIMILLLGFVARNIAMFDKTVLIGALLIVELMILNSRKKIN